MGETRLHPDCEEELRSLKGKNNKLLSKVLRDVRLLREFGLELLEENRVKKLTDNVYELRTTQGSDTHRLLFGIAEERMFLLAVSFVKKSQKTPKGKIELAERRLREWEK